MKKENKTAVKGTALVIASLLAVGGVLWLLKQTDPTVSDCGEEVTKEEEILVAEAVPEITEITVQPMVTSDPAEIIVPLVEVAVPTVAGKLVQPIQEEPKKPDAPEEKPELKEGEDVTNPDKVPEYVEDPKPSEKPDDTVVTRQPTGGNPGAIWVEGFGWVEYSGPSHSDDAPEIYMNGNKIGDM